jgi:hypothetical protein
MCSHAATNGSEHSSVVPVEGHTVHDEIRRLRDTIHEARLNEQA